MLEDVINNPIDTPRGYKNPDTGIALRGPLSQLFSAIYLKPLDDAFDGMDVFYARYQDDLLILCKTRAQFNRCRRKLMNVLHERRLGLSRKKSRCGPLNTEFHFLGINYSGTRTPNNTTCIFDNENQKDITDNIYFQNDLKTNLIYNISARKEKRETRKKRETRNEKRETRNEKREILPFRKSSSRTFMHEPSCTFTS